MAQRIKRMWVLLALAAVSAAAIAVVVTLQAGDGTKTSPPATSPSASATPSYRPDSWCAQHPDDGWCTFTPGDSTTPPLPSGSEWDSYMQSMGSEIFDQFGSQTP